MKNLKNVFFLLLLLLTKVSLAGEKIAVAEAAKDPFFQAAAGVWKLSESLDGQCSSELSVEVQKGFVSSLDSISLYSENKSHLLYHFSALNAGTFYFWGTAIQETLERAKSPSVSAYTLNVISRGYTVFAVDEKKSLTTHISQINDGPVELHLTRALSQSSYLTILKTEFQDCVYTKAEAAE